MVTSLRQIDEFWGLKRLAVVGVSRDPKHFSYGIWQELRQRRYEAVPVNPNATEIDGQRCYGSMFAQMRRHLAGRLSAPVLELKSRTGRLSESNRRALERFIAGA